ncbi:MAG: hypothetical protein F6K65_42615 [Moorea sp. SIO3C2]|nr:hypothetical protein [Moorena sp. SIO3C2]
MSSTNNKKQKRMKGVPVHYDELKRKHTIMITDTVWEWLKTSAKEADTSVGEFIERWGRSKIF